MKTEPIRIKSGKYVNTLMRMWLERRGYGLILFPLAALAGGYFNSAFYFVAAMILFLIYPLILFFVYFNFALDPRTALLIHYPYTIYFQHNKLAVEFMPRETDEDEGIGIPEGFSVPYDMIRVHTDSYAITAEGPERMKIVIIPFSAIPSQNELKEILKMIYEKTDSVS